jgi:protease PrsW
MPLIAALLLGFIPSFIYAAMIYWLDRYEKEPLLLLGGVFLWGAIVASAGAFLLNTTFGIGVYALTGSEQAADISMSSLSAPIIEETLKGFAVLIVFFFARREFDSVLDGIVYAAVTALGFAATENAYYIYTYGFEKSGWLGLVGIAFIRVILVGWQHPFYTAFIGIGLAISRLNRNWMIKLAAPLAGGILSMFTHSFHNTLPSLFPGPGTFIGFLFDWTGWIAMFIFILFLIAREKQWMFEYLKDEVHLGILTPPQYQTAISASRRLVASFAALEAGTYHKTNRFYQLCAELSHKKHQFVRMGDEDGNTQIIVDLRSQLVRLSPDAAA